MVGACGGGSDAQGNLDARDLDSELATDDTGPRVTGDFLGIETSTDSPLPPEPVFWSLEATKTVDDLVFAKVNGENFFALGFDTGGGPVYDGVTGPNQCDKATGEGYLDIQVQKNQLAHESGANLAYVWGFGDKAESLLAFEPQFYGSYRHDWGTAIAIEKDVIPVFYNAFGESDFDTDPEVEIPKMKAAFEEWKNRAGVYSKDNLPLLPSFEELPWMAWHPTSRMIGNPGNGFEQHTPELATEFAQTTNMMIGDHYSYVVNRFDWNDPGEAIMALATWQVGDKGEGYDDWLAWDDPDHQAWFTAGWDLANSLVNKRTSGSLVWMWLQGYSFGKSVDGTLCEKGISDHYAVGPFPTRQYLRKEITSVIAAGATGFIFFGWGMALMWEAEEMASFYKALSMPEVYEPALTSPRLDLGYDTRHVGKLGYDGQGRVHAIVKWDEKGKHAFVIAANPGGRATEVTLKFPWSLAKVERLNWDTPGFEPAEDVAILNTEISWTMPLDEGEILRITPLYKDQ